MNIGQKSFKTFIVIENGFCLFRNYCNFSVVAKTFILAIVFAEILLSVYIIYTRINGFEHTYLFLSKIYSIGCVLLSCYYSKSFMRFLRCINSSNADFENDNTYSKQLASNFKICLTLMSAYLFIFCLMVTTRRPIELQDHLLIFSRLIANCRVHLEYVFLFYTLFILCIQLEHLTKLVKNESLYDEDSDAKLSVNLEKWRCYYINVQNCAVLINEIYGVQLSLSFCLFTIQHITKCYITASFGMDVSRNVLGSVAFLTNMLFSILLMIMMTRAAQRLQNNARNLTRCLSQLLVQSHTRTGKQESKAVKQLLRIVSSHPINIKAFGAIDINMTLIPACATLVASYTVVALQFNNVV